MNALETLFWRAENHPGMRSNMVGVFVLDRCPDWERFVGRHEWSTRVVPRLRHRALEPPLRLGRPFWVPDETFDVRNHVHRVRLPTPCTTRQLLDLVGAVVSRPLAPERPLWEATLVEDWDDGHGGKAAYLLKLHHSLCDGMGAVQLITVLLGEAAASAAEPALPPAHRRAAHATTLLAGRLAKVLLALPSAATRAARGTRAGFPRLKVPSAGRVVKRVVSFARTTLVPPAPASPLLRERSNAVHLDALDFPRKAFRAAGKAGDGTLNDVFVAGLMGGVDRYHRHFGVDLPELPMLIPISVRKHDDLPAGNRLASTRLAMPVSGLDPVTRIVEAGRRIATVRSKSTLRALDLLTRPLAPLPGPVVRFALSQMFRGNDLIATNFSGPPGRLGLAGSQVLGILPFPPLLCGATSIALTTYQDRCHIGITLDTGAFTDPDAFVAALRESFEELFALAPRDRVAPLTG
nr:wax ester/triacylglycerol synthase domain-containing protein [Saccharothrix espanaensis]